MKKHILFGACCLYVVCGIAAYHFLQSKPQSVYAIMASPQQKTTVHQQQQISVSKRLVRLWQLDPGQYQSQEQFHTWAMSACSTAAMTEVLNAWAGYQKYKIQDILSKELEANAISAQMGLLDNDGIARTMKLFGFSVRYPSLDVQQLIAVANQGTPVIVGWPPDKWAGGHLLVVIGGSSTQVYLADSSNYNFTHLPYTTFLSRWGGLAAVATPL